MWIVDHRSWVGTGTECGRVKPVNGCQTTLLRLLEDWRNALEKNQYVAAVLMDLSKAFEVEDPRLTLGVPLFGCQTNCTGYH
jgi:hypothetical protein